MTTITVTNQDGSLAGRWLYTGPLHELLVRGVFATEWEGSIPLDQVRHALRAVSLGIGYATALWPHTLPEA